MRAVLRLNSFALLATTVALAAACGTPPTTDAGDAGDAATARDVIAQDVVATDVPTDTTTLDATDAALPDLTIDPALLRQNVQFSVQYFAPNACEINEACVGAPGWRRLLTFTTFTPNVGTADLNLGMSSATNPNFEYSECHHHYHFRGYADYSLLGSDGGVAAEGHKQSFCVEDLQQVNTDPGVRTSGYYDACGTGGGMQGISVGWADDYYPNLPCQWIDVTDVPAGSYTLRVQLNTERRFAELDYTNNEADVPVTIPASWTGTNPLASCTSTGPYQGMGRNCGWSVSGSYDCNPGDTISVGCNAGCGLGSCTGSWDLRICDGNAACEGGDFAHVLQQDSGECSSGVFSLESTCPVATFTCPASGRYTVMSGADYAGDRMSSCNLATRVTPAGADGGVSDGGSDASTTDAGATDATSTDATGG